MAKRRVFVAALVAAAVALPLVIAPNASAARSRAGVVVLHEEGDATPSVECVKFKGNKIRGINLLNATTFDLYTNAHPDFGRGICWMDGVGHAPPGCTSGGSMFWSQWVQQSKDRPVKFAPLGPSSQMIRNGGVYYLQWGDFDQAPPEEISLKSICSPDV